MLATSNMLHPQEDQDNSFSPTPSHADSFATAYTSPPGNSEEQNPQLLSLPLHFPTQGLRKSMSVDSFVHFGRDNDPTGAPHPNRGNTGSTFDLHNNHTPAYNYFLHGRNHRSSIESTGEVDGSVDSDVERSDPMERYRHPSLKDSSRPHIRGGELPLPSRTPASSSTSSMSSMASTSASSSSTLEDVPRQQPLPSLQSFTGRPISSATPNRTRSGSLGTYMNTGRQRPYETRQPASGAPYTLALVGTSGCGKSSAIRYGLRDHRLVRIVPTRASTRYPRQDWQVRSGESSFPLHVIEIDVPPGQLAPAETTHPPDWLDTISEINGVIICYDANDQSSFSPVEGLLRRVYQAAKVPYIVLACKSDLQHEVEPREASEMIQQYDAGLVEGAKSHSEGRKGLRNVFSWILMAIERDRRHKGNTFQNSASPSILRLSPWRTATPTASSSRRNESEDIDTSPTNPLFPTSPTRAHSTGDLLHTPHELNVAVGPHPVNADGTNTHRRVDSAPPQPPAIGSDEVDTTTRIESKEKESRPGQWATLDELLDKLLFLAVSGDDPSFITHFLLTYRRFASPRSVILAMQKRIRELDDDSLGDPMFACFAQMRICHLLEVWIRDYEHDFAVPNAGPALNALITAVVSKTHLLHYGSEFLPFLECLPKLVDHDAAWASKVVDKSDESDDSYNSEEEEIHLPGPEPTAPSPTQDEPVSTPSGTRERKPSFPLPAMLVNGPKVGPGQADPETSEKQQIKELLKLAQEIQALEPEEIAQEITLIEVKLFLDIKPRHWLSYTFVSKKEEHEPISAFNAFSNHLADWVVSLILCHKTPRARVKQIEKLLEIAQRLRALNNYSALRAFIAGINNATFAGEETMEQFKAKSPDQDKNLRSWDVLFQAIRSHRAYRLALRNSKGACIPALEVHMSDLIKAHEGNGDFHSSDPNKIHWGKFNMMGKFISSTVQCQAQCKTAADYSFTERAHIRELLGRPVMNDQMQKSRIAPIDPEDDYRPIHPSTGPPRDAALLRKLIFW